MRISQVAVFESKKPERTRISSALLKAGLRVSGAEETGALRKEQAIVIGPNVASPAKVAKDIRKVRPEALVLAALKGGTKAAWADAVVPLPLSPNDLKVRLPELVKLRTLARNLQAAADPQLLPPRPGEGILDPLTGFYTFAHFKDVLFIEVKRARRYNIPLSLALIGYDPIAGEVGEELRARLLRGLALSIRRSLRDTDFAVQYLDDRVLLLMPHTDLQGAQVVSSRICERVARATLEDGERIVRPTISVGVSGARAPGREFSFGDLAREAQAALERAMAHGGNRVEFEVPDAEP